ncbi:hypothetical protein BASA50_003793 [Batrachochytrium salamandrivorans]|uniref:Uncharacterized protein n=1 Tax=Batrachochytrium salamandrivorans TaxID=1357716 RepID=A0ABQ8FHH8_9FUNG|nr:hypothetical protein BASA50_003793 [Batrachochytrium salamandrivorans]
MKLISFAALSFLAITVSAYPGLDILPQSTDAQSQKQSQSIDVQSQKQSQSVEKHQGTDIQSQKQSQSAEKHQGTDVQSQKQPQSTNLQSQKKSQSTTTQSAKKSQDEVRAKIKELEKTHKEKEKRLTRAKENLSTSQQQVIPSIGEVDTLWAELQDPSIGGREKVRLNRKHDEAKAALAELIVECSERSLLYTDAVGAFNEASAQVQLLKENHELIASYNTNYMAQMGPDPGSFHNSVFLATQYEEIVTETKMLSGENKSINGAGPELLVDDLRVRLKENEDRLLTLQSLAKAAKGILEEMGVHVAN